MTRPAPIEERLLRNLVLDGSCWSWTARVNKRTGYGTVTVDQRKMLAHRVAFETWVRPIPEGLTLDHLCANRRCINPAHLEPVTLRDNILRSSGMAARNARKTHCLRGHPLDGINRTSGPRPWRYCLTCHREAVARYRRAQRGA